MTSPRRAAVALASLTLAASTLSGCGVFGSPDLEGLKKVLDVPAPA